MRWKVHSSPICRSAAGAGFFFPARRHRADGLGAGDHALESGRGRLGDAVATTEEEVPEANLQSRLGDHRNELDPRDLLDMGWPRRRRIHTNGMPSGTERKAFPAAARREGDRCDSTVVCTFVRQTYAPGSSRPARSTSMRVACSLSTASTG